MSDGRNEGRRLQQLRSSNAAGLHGKFRKDRKNKKDRAIKDSKEN